MNKTNSKLICLSSEDLTWMRDSQERSVLIRLQFELLNGDFHENSLVLEDLESEEWISKLFHRI